LAARIASELSAEHISVTEPKPRTNGTIALDMLFGRTPKVDPTVSLGEDHGLVVIVGPTWMGQVAAPLRACLKALKASANPYAFVSVSGGADGPNPKLARELKRRVGREPVAVINLLVVDLLPSDPKPTREDTSAYRLTDEDATRLTNEVVKTLRQAMAE
jgi:hypothetical protein